MNTNSSTTTNNANSTPNPQPTQPTQPKTHPLLDPSLFPQSSTTPSIHISLVYTPLDIPSILSFIRSPTSGANILFLGTTRNNFDNRPVTTLEYSAYPALALKTLSKIAEDVIAKYSVEGGGGVEKVVIVHRLGVVGVGEESIAVAVSSGHRESGWGAAREVLERTKERAEIWKREWFGDEEGEGVWRANKDRDGSGRLVGGKEEGKGEGKGKVVGGEDVRSMAVDDQG